MRGTRRILIASIAASLTSCAGSPDSQTTDSGTAGRDSARLLGAGDSCMTLPARALSANYANPADAPREPPVAPGRWDSVVTVTTSAFAIDVPAVAVARADSAAGSWIFSPLPVCGTRCNLGIRIYADSTGKGVDAHVAALLRQEARIDSINADPSTVAQRFNNWDGPARKTMMFDTTGLLLDGNCGDCFTATLFVGRPGQIAEITYGIDQVPDFSRRQCQLLRAATSFRWRK